MRGGWTGPDPPFLPDLSPLRHPRTTALTAAATATDFVAATVAVTGKASSGNEGAAVPSPRSQRRRQAEAAASWTAAAARAAERSGSGGPR